MPARGWRRPAVAFVNVRQLLMLSLVILIAGLGRALRRARHLADAGLPPSSARQTFFSSTILLLDYYGRKPNLELFSIVNLISTVGSVGPVFGGFVADQTIASCPFLMLGVLVLLVLIAVAWMKPPTGFQRERGVRRLSAGRQRWFFNTPVLDGGWPQNDAAIIADEEGLDFVMSMRASGSALAATPIIGAAPWDPSP